MRERESTRSRAGETSPTLRWTQIFVCGQSIHVFESHIAGVARYDLSWCLVIELLPLRFQLRRPCELLHPLFELAEREWPIQTGSISVIRRSLGDLL